MRVVRKYHVPPLVVLHLFSSTTRSSTLNCLFFSCPTPLQEGFPVPMIHWPGLVLSTGCLRALPAAPALQTATIRHLADGYHVLLSFIPPSILAGSLGWWLNLPWTRHLHQLPPYLPLSSHIKHETGSTTLIIRYTSLSYTFFFSASNVLLFSFLFFSNVRSLSLCECLWCTTPSRCSVPIVLLL